MIRTHRLQLIPCDLHYLDVFLRNRTELARLLQVTIPEAFPVFPGSFAYWYDQLKADSSLAGWWSWLFVHQADRVVIGDGGFKGLPTEQGIVEIGYALVPDYRRQGFATEAARGLVEWAFAHPSVTAVLAETLVHGYESMGVLTKLGMSQVGMRHDPDDGAIVQWCVRREQYRAGSGAE